MELLPTCLLLLIMHPSSTKIDRNSIGYGYFADSSRSFQHVDSRSLNRFEMYSPTISDDMGTSISFGSLCSDTSFTNKTFFRIQENHGETTSFIKHNRALSCDYGSACTTNQMGPTPNVSFTTSSIVSAVGNHDPKFRPLQNGAEIR
jgi:hypothetical protein